VSAVDATALANELTGDTIAANMLMVGYAFQKGLLPLQLESILRAVELNGVSVEFNRRALELGRRLAVEEPRSLRQPRDAFTLDALIQDRYTRLIEYQDERYAQRYRDLVLAVREAEQKVLPGSETLCVAVARNYARLLAYKDEYEVARLYSSNEFRQQLECTFSGRPRLTLLLAPPSLFKPRAGAPPPRKRQFGPWIFGVLRVLARLKGLRRTPFDPFGHTAERKLERQLIRDYERLLDELIAKLSPGNHAAAVRLASVPEQVKGFGHVKLRNLARAKADEARWLQGYRNDAVASEST
jgi:indolepyruvate ferredoxin oxidoreductase